MQFSNNVSTTEVKIIRNDMRRMCGFYTPNSFSFISILRIFLGVKSGRRLRLTALPSVSRMSENVGTSTSRNPKGLHGLCRDNFTFTLKTI
jgi:hypothetical protein